MNHNLSSLKQLYDLDEKQLASFICMLCSMNVGEQLTSKLATITKLENNQFEVTTTKKSIENLVKEITHDEDISSAFN